MVAEGTLLWEPTEEIVKRAKLTRYLESAGRAGQSYEEVWRWSVERPEEFWASIWDHFQVVGERGDGPVLSGTMPGVEWFAGSSLNYAENALRHSGGTAVVFVSEDGARQEIGHDELREEVARVRAGLVRLGVGRGDRVAAYLPNIPQALVAFLATASLGAIWSAGSPDFGVAGVVDRFRQIEPKVLIAVDGYRYNGKAYDRSDAVNEIAAALPSLRATVWIPYLSAAAEGLPPQRAEPAPGPARSVPHGEVIGWEGLRAESGPLEFERVPFGHPLWILYSSGTTGLPKPIVHGHGGVVLEHLKSLSFHQDLGEGDVFFWYTTTGWMMWNYLIGALLVGAVPVLYDGSATHPSPATLWRIAASEGVTYFGVGAPYIMASLKAGLRPEGLERLRGVGSTGSPLPPEGFAWVHEELPDVPIGSFSGGTDVCTGFVGATVLHPIRAGVIPCRSLGAAVEAYDPEGRSVTGEVGELVLTRPMPSMPVMFWNDPDGERYRDSYFDVYPGVWRHGDWIRIDDDGSCVIYGRSDSTLNRGGVRMGTSEFYRVVERFEEIADSLVIDTGVLGQEGRLLLYVTLAEGAEMTDDLTRALCAALRDELSPRHVPNEIRAVPGIPRTLSGKKLEVPVRKILLGTPVEQAANPDAMANPEVLEHFRPSDPLREPEQA
ncbi:acetoacetate--CoA ligase [Nonomuraea roseoviolacea]|uniref:Acetoacetyl-CoA synthetase n=1 Tax=Nonomuraea roseoviolacea subsp. carminata TaxID=160689 RepID=A0ABT1JWK8_9ACTN|nr:acetoacetate--CoA ligase [Nonomuraea roseoviolacea]MCP2345792.1 acetoacetyl-CoA synthetase [Nonomuraea roseoviolacea subsp. carminata]